MIGCQYECPNVLTCGEYVYVYEYVDMICVIYVEIICMFDIFVHDALKYS